MEKIVGIYGLRNTITNKWYVGQSRNIYGRWRKYRFCVCPNQPKLRNALQRKILATKTSPCRLPMYLRNVLPQYLETFNQYSTNKFNIGAMVDLNPMHR